MANQRTSCNGVRCVCVCVFLRFKWQTQKMGWCHLDCSFSYSSLLFRWDVWGMGFFFLDSHAFFSPNHQTGEGFVYACVWYIRGFSDLMWFFSFLFFPFGNPITWASVISGCALWSLSYHDALFVFWGDPFVNYSNIIFVCGHDSSQRFWVCS